MSSDKELDFPRTTNHKIWEDYLDRKLSVAEITILEEVKIEKKFNERLDELASIAGKKGLYIPALTGLYGNCLFESLQILGFTDDHDELRKDISFVMKTFKNHKNFFPERSETLTELFVFANEIEFVLDKDTQELWKYTYDIMCKDLSTGFSWTRLPTQLILMIVSFLFNAKIHIVSNTSDYQHTIYCGTDNSNLVDIFLGHIGEVHYVPLCKMKDGETYDTPKYSDARVVYFRWARAIAMSRSTAQDSSNYDLLGGSNSSNSFEEAQPTDTSKTVNYE